MAEWKEDHHMSLLVTVTQRLPIPPRQPKDVLSTPSQVALMDNVIQDLLQDLPVAPSRDKTTDARRLMRRRFLMRDLVVCHAVSAKFNSIRANDNRAYIVLQLENRLAAAYRAVPQLLQEAQQQPDTRETQSSSFRERSLSTSAPQAAPIAAFRTEPFSTNATATNAPAAASLSYSSSSSSSSSHGNSSTNGNGNSSGNNNNGGGGGMRTRSATMNTLSSVSPVTSPKKSSALSPFAVSRLRKTIGLGDKPSAAVNANEPMERASGVGELIDSSPFLLEPKAWENAEADVLEAVRPDASPSLQVTSVHMQLLPLDGSRSRTDVDMSVKVHAEMDLTPFTLQPLEVFSQPFRLITMNAIDPALLRTAIGVRFRVTYDVCLGAERVPITSSFQTSLDLSQLLSSSRSDAITVSVHVPAAQERRVFEPFTVDLMLGNSTNSPLDIILSSAPERRLQNDLVWLDDHARLGQLAANGRVQITLRLMASTTGLLPMPALNIVDAETQNVLARLSTLPPLTIA